MKKNILFLLAIIAAFAVHAQQKVPDVTRFSKAPLGPAKTGHAVAKRMQARSINGTPDMTRFSKAPINTSGGTARSAARKINTAARTQQPSSLPSNQPAAKTPVVTPAKQLVLEQEAQAPADKH